MQDNNKANPESEEDSVAGKKGKGQKKQTTDSEVEDADFEVVDDK